MIAMTEMRLQRRPFSHAQQRKLTAIEGVLHDGPGAARKRNGIRAPARGSMNDAALRIQASTGGPGKPPEGGGMSGGSGGANGGSGGDGNSGGRPKPAGPRDLAQPVDYSETGGGTGPNANSQPGANAAVVGAHGGTDAAAGATPAGTAGTMERAPAGSEAADHGRQADGSSHANAPLSPPGRDQSKPDSPLFGDRADAPAASADNAGSPAAGAGAAGGTGLGEAASASDTRNDATSTGGTGIPDASGASDAGRR